MNLSWSAVSGATSYAVWRGTTSGGPYTAIATLLSGTTYSDTGLAATLSGTTYYYVVTAENHGGDGAYSPQAAVAVLPLLPQTPTGLTAAPDVSGAINLSWNASANAVTYTIQRATGASGPYATIASGLTATNYTDTALTNYTTYYYAVVAVNGAGISGAANASATATDFRVHLPFDDGSGATAADTSGNGFPGTLVGGPTWTTGELGGAVDLNGSSEYVSLPTGVVDGLSDFTVATWVDMTSESQWMRIFDFGTGTTDYMFLTADGGSNAVRFAITTGGNTQEQQINGTAALPVGAWTYVAVTLTGGVGTLYINGVQVGQNASMTLTPSSLGATTQNYIGKSQFNDPYLKGLVDDFRVYSRALSATEIYTLAHTLAPAAPTNLSAAAGAGQAALSWTAVSGAASYDVGRSLTTGGPYTIVASGLSATNYTDTGLTNGTKYCYVVSAVNVAAEGGNSSQVNATPIAPTVLAPAADSYVRGGLFAGDNYGSDTVLWVKNDPNASVDYQSYLKFNLTSVASPVQAAYLDLTPVYLGTGTSGITITIQLVPDSGDNWTQNGLTWNNASQGAGLTATIAGSQLQIGVPVQVDVTALVNQTFNANGLATFQVYASSPASSSQYVELASSNNGTAAWRPTLIVIPNGAGANTAVVNGAAVAVAGNPALPIAGGPLVVENGGAVDLGQTVQNVAAVTLANGTIGNGTLNGTAYNVIQGTISANLAGQTAALVKSGPGTVVLSGTNTYSGGTSVSDGTLVVASANSLPDGQNIAVGSTGLFATATPALIERVTYPAASSASLLATPAATEASAATVPAVSPAAVGALLQLLFTADSSRKT